MSLHGNQEFATVFSTSLSWFSLVGEGNSLKHLSFGYKNRASAVKALGSAGIDIEFIDCEDLTDWNFGLISRLADFFDGQLISDETVDTFGDIKVDLSHLSPFQQRVVRHCRKIAPGETATYGEIADRAGGPGAARAVGNVMAQNRVPIVIPCHRVVGSGGSLGGYSAPGGLTTKQQLLDMEQNFLAAIPA